MRSIRFDSIRSETTHDPKKDLPPSAVVTAAPVVAKKDSAPNVVAVVMPTPTATVAPQGSLRCRHHVALSY
jgi:hypothetical protein